MRTIRLLLIGAAAVTMAAGCSSAPISPEQLQTWVGRPIADIEREWGPATREVADGSQKILVYEHLESKSGTDFQKPPEAGGARRMAQQTANDAVRGPTVYARSYLFWVDAAGKIVRAELRALTRGGRIPRRPSPSHRPPCAPSRPGLYGVGAARLR